MADEKNKAESRDENKPPALKPDAETLHTTDPQKNMEGPVSSLMHDTGDAFESGKSQEEADAKRDKNM